MKEKFNLEINPKAKAIKCHLVQENRVKDKRSFKDEDKGILYLSGKTKKSNIPIINKILFANDKWTPKEVQKFIKENYGKIKSGEILQQEGFSWNNGEETVKFEEVEFDYDSYTQNTTNSIDPVDEKDDGLICSLSGDIDVDKGIKENREITEEEKTGWVEVLRAGKYNGVNVDKSNIENIFKNAQDGRDIPLKIEHVEGGGALGWVSRLKLNDNRLYVKFRKGVNPLLKTAVNYKIYPKRSVELSWEKGNNQTMRLDAIAFLGASQPAVAGMKDFSFLSEKRQRAILSELVEDEDAMLTFDAKLKEFDKEVSKNMPNEDIGKNEIELLKKQYEELNQRLSQEQQEKKALLQEVLKQKREYAKAQMRINNDEFVKSGKLTPKETELKVEFEVKKEDGNVEKQEYSLIDFEVSLNSEQKRFFFEFLNQRDAVLNKKIEDLPKEDSGKVKLQELEDDKQVSDGLSNAIDTIDEQIRKTQSRFGVTYTEAFEYVVNNKPIKEVK